MNKGLRSSFLPLFFVVKERDGVAASKNWKTEVFPSPPEWNEYIPKKNRHSESVPRDLHWREMDGCNGSSALERGIRGGKFFFVKSVQHPVFPSGRPPQY